MVVKVAFVGVMLVSRSEPWLEGRLAGEVGAQNATGRLPLKQKERPTKGLR